MSCVKVFFFSFNIWIVNSISLDEQFLLLEQILRKWFEPRSNVPWLKKIIWVIGALRRTVVIDWRFDNLCRSHLQSQVVELVSWKFKNPGERFDWSVDRVAAHVFTANHITHLPTATLSTDQSNRSLGFLNFQLTNTTTWLWRWLLHTLSKRQSITTVLLRAPITQMIFFKQEQIL